MRKFVRAGDENDHRVIRSESGANNNMAEHAAVRFLIVGFYPKVCRNSSDSFHHPVAEFILNDACIHIMDDSVAAFLIKSCYKFSVFFSDRYLNFIPVTPWVFHAQNGIDGYMRQVRSEEHTSELQSRF